MRRAFLFGIPLFALLLTGLLWSHQNFMQDPAWVGSMTPPSGGAACSTPTNATVNEGFETPGYENIGAWTEVGTVVDDQAMVGVSPPTNSCSYCFKYAGSAGNYARYDSGSLHTNWSVGFWFYVEALPASAGYTTMVELRENTTFGGAASALIRNTGGVPVLYAFDGTTYTVVGAAFVTNEWHHVQFKGTCPTNAWTMQLDGASETAFTSGNKTPRYVAIGASTLTQGGIIYLDIVQWNYTNNAYIP